MGWGTEEVVGDGRGAGVSVMADDGVGTAWANAGLSVSAATSRKGTRPSADCARNRTDGMNCFLLASDERDFVDDQNHGADEVRAKEAEPNEVQLRRPSRWAFGKPRHTTR